MPEEEEEKPQQPIIVVKKKGGHGGHHGGAWKVAYADFVTAMMAFFLVMWLVTQSDEVKQAVAGYFNDPANYGKMIKGSGVLKGSPAPRTTDPMLEKRNELMLLRKAAQNIKRVMEDNPEITGLRDQVEMTITPRGLRIQLVDKGIEQTFFELGSARLSQEAKKIIQIIGEELGSLPNDIVVEGHTDRRKYSRKDYTNWELSADRANTARRVLVESGVKDHQLFSVEGYADRFPKILDDPYDERNRRIAILVLIKSESTRYYTDSEELEDIF